MILYETGILYHWSQSKVNYITKSYLEGFDLAKELYPESISAANRILAKDDKFSFSSVSLSKTQSTFILLTYLILICQTVMLLELIFPFVKTYAKNRKVNMNSSLEFLKRYSSRQSRIHMSERTSFKFKKYSYC
jgi:hypothetical protein